MRQSTHAAVEVVKRQTDRGRETEMEEKGVSVERIYEWGLSAGEGPGPSVVHSSVIFTAPQAPMCLPVAALYAHRPTRTRLHACAYRPLQTIPVSTITL